MIKRHITRAYHAARPHAGQFGRYLISGGMAFVCDFGTFYVLENVFGIWYVTASFIGSVIGFFAAFTFHKFLVFKKHEQSMKQFIRYGVMQLGNAMAQTALIYLFVEFLGIPSSFAKILSIGCSVMWNFFLYKFFVYA